MALVTSLLRASSFFFRSSELESSISNWAMASLRAVSIFSFVLPLSLRDNAGSVVISSTREIYDSSCCRASNFLLKASSLFLNLAASKTSSVQLCGRFSRALTANHVLNLARREFTDRVGNRNVRATSRRLFSSSDLEDTVDVDFKDNLKDGVTSLHRRYRCKGKFTQRGVVLAVDTLALEHWKLHSLLVICDGGEGSVIKCISICSWWLRKCR